LFTLFFGVLPGKAAPKLTTIAAFDNANGADPRAGLILDAAGNLYGTTYHGGETTLNSGIGYGSVFEVNGATHAINTLATFNSVNGADPLAGLIADSAGNLYGTTSDGEAVNGGSVFEVVAGSHIATSIATFNRTNAGQPVGGVIADTHGNLYGTTYNGGGVFRVAAGDRTVTIFAALDGANGKNPLAGLTADAAGNLYGTTSSYGPGLFGTVFRVDAVTHAVTTVAAFNGKNGASPHAGVLIDASGNIYGTTYGGRQDLYGTVFEIVSGTNKVTTLVTFDATNGAFPAGTLIADADGNLYGTASAGGPGGYGSVFQIAAATHTLKTLAAFNYDNGGSPFGNVVADAQGNLYGTTSFARNSYGTVFEITDTGFVVPEPGLLAIFGVAAIALLGRPKRVRYTPLIS
jgi:uncharacterized repeat protein (TIGR03803 family)